MGPFNLDADEKKIFIFRDLNRCGDQAEIDKDKNLCGNTIEIQYDSPNEDALNPPVRAIITDFGPQLSGAKIENGWLWLKYKDVAGKEKIKRYLVGMKPMREMLQMRWWGMKWKTDPADETDTDITIPNSCVLDSDCRKHFDQSDSNAHWVGRPQSD